MKKRTMEEANKERLGLLSKKFTTGLTPFEAARLAIVSREVEEGWPAFTAADFARLDRITKAATISRIRLRRPVKEDV